MSLLFCLQDLSSLDQNPCVVLHESFHFFFMPFWNWLKYRYETLWNKIAEPRRGHNLVHCLFSFLTTQYFLQCISQLWLHSTLSLKYKSFDSTCLSLWGINIFCTVPRLCLNMEIFETIGVLFFEKKLDDLEFFQCIKFLKNVSLWERNFF